MKNYKLSKLYVAIEPTLFDYDTDGMPCICGYEPVRHTIHPEKHWRNSLVKKLFKPNHFENIHKLAADCSIDLKDLPF